MHFPSEGYYATQLVPWLTLLLVLLAAIAALRLVRRTFGDRTKDELDRLSNRYARGLLSFDQYQRGKAKIRQQNVKALEAPDSRSSTANETSGAEEPGSGMEPKPEPIEARSNETEFGNEPPPRKE